MKPFIVALGVGLLVGIIYGLLNVRSPAPPYVALVGLLGILLGEHAVTGARLDLARSRRSRGAAHRPRLRNGRAIPLA